MEQVVEVNTARVATLAESILDHLETLQEDYSELEMVYAVITIYEGIAATIQERINAAEKDSD